MDDVRAMLIAAVNREVATMAAEDEAVATGLAQRRRGTASSVVFSVRLDPGEVTALEARAAALGIKPSVLARNLLRMSLGAPSRDALADVADRLAAAVDDLHALVGAPVGGEAGGGGPAPGDG